jgi:hypothetical protein
MVYAVHQVPGRLRIRNPAIKANERAAASYSDVVRCLPGVHAARASRVTGSVVIEYDPRVTSADELLQLLEARCLPKSRQRDRVAERLGRVVIERLLEHSAGALIAALI